MAVRFEITSTDGRLAQTWLENARTIVTAIRTHRSVVPFVPDLPLLDLVETYLDIWADVARDAEVFTWEANVEVESVEQVAKQWRLIASLTDAELAALGCRWAPEETAPFYDALLAGFVDALGQEPRTAPLAEQLLAQPPGTA